MTHDELRKKMESLCLQFSYEALGIADEEVGMKPLMDLFAQMAREVIGKDENRPLPEYDPFEPIRNALRAKQRRSLRKLVKGGQ